MSLGSRLTRVARLGHLLGLREAVALEAAWTLGRPLIHVQVPGYRNAFVLRRDVSDRSSFEQVFLEETCALPFTASAPRTIVDAGAHVGFTAAWYAERYAKATVIALEPSAVHCVLLRQNTCAYPNVRVLRTALWSRGAKLRVKDPDAPPWSRHVEECAAGMSHCFEALSIPDLLDQTSEGTIDLLKLDVESAQRVLFSPGVDDWIGRVRTFVIDLRGADSDALVRSALRSRSFVERVRGQKVIFQRVPAPIEARTAAPPPESVRPAA